jgi:hypothetical protein
LPESSSGPPAFPFRPRILPASRSVPAIILLHSNLLRHARKAPSSFSRLLPASVVIPLKTGIQKLHENPIPACAGMTEKEESDNGRLPREFVSTIAKYVETSV